MQNPLSPRLYSMANAIEAMHPELLAKMGAQGLAFVSENFRLQGFQGEVFEPWDKRDPDPSPGRGILIGKGSGHLKNSIHIVSIGNGSVTIGTGNIPYARIHNEGGTINHPARESILNYNRVHGKLKLGRVRTLNQQRNIKEIRRANVGAYSIDMPRRHYAGPSPVITKDVKAMLNQTIFSKLKIIR